MKRKITSLLMALVMALSLAVPAFAQTNYYWEVPDTGSTELTQSLTFAATTKVPTIALKMPVVGANPVVLNPYKIAYTGEVTLNGVDNGAGHANDQTKQIISPVYAIQNESDVPLKVTVKASSTVSGDFKFASNDVAATEKNKSAYVKVEFGVQASGTLGLIATNAEQKIPDANKTAAGSTEIVLKTGDVGFPTGTSISLPCPTRTTSNNTTTVSPNFLQFQFTGNAAQEPNPSGWTADDKFTTVLAFTFLPGGNTVSNGNSGGGGNQQQAQRTTVNGNDDGTNVTFTFTAPNDADSTPNYTATGMTITSGTTATIASSSVTGYSSAAQNDPLTHDLDITYAKSGGGTGTISITVSFGKA